MPIINNTHQQPLLCKMATSSLNLTNAGIKGITDELFGRLNTFDDAGLSTLSLEEHSIINFICSTYNHMVSSQCIFDESILRANICIRILPRQLKIIVPGCDTSCDDIEKSSIKDLINTLIQRLTFMVERPTPDYYTKRKRLIEPYERLCTYICSAIQTMKYLATTFGYHQQDSLITPF